MAEAKTRSYEVVEGWEQLPQGYVHRDVAGWRWIARIASS